MARLILFLLLFTAIALVLRGQVFFSIVIFLAALHGVSRLWLRRSIRHIDVNRRFTSHAFCGDTVNVDLTVRNNGRLPVPWLEVSESTPIELDGVHVPSQVIGLGPRKTRQFGYSLICRSRGYYRLGPLHGQTGDLLGSEVRYLRWAETEHLTVYPRVVPLERLGLPTRSALVTHPARAPLFEDPSRITGVRDYQPGDSPRRIHWPATARTGRMVVKQYQPAIARETLLCLDLDSQHYSVRRYEAIEQAVVVAASLANHVIVREHLPVGLCTEARDAADNTRRRVTINGGSDRVHLINILETLARVQPVTESAFPQLLRHEGARRPWGSTIVGITGRVDDDLAETVTYLKRTGYAVALILIQPAARPVEDRSVSLAGIPIYRAWNDAEMAVLR